MSSKAKQAVAHVRSLVQAKLKQPIHPVWLEIQDKQMQEEYEAEDYKVTLRRMCFVLLVLWCFSIFRLILEGAALFEHMFDLVMIIAANLLLTVCVVFGTFFPRSMAYISLIQLISRCVLTYIMFWTIENGKAGLSNDRKMMADSFALVFFLWTIMVKIRPRLDLLLAPPVLVANYLTV